MRSVGAGMELGAVEADIVEDCFFFFSKSKKKSRRERRVGAGLQCHLDQFGWMNWWEEGSKMNQIEDNAGGRVKVEPISTFCSRTSSASRSLDCLL